MKRIRSIFGCLIIVALLAGCASSPASKKAVITERAERMFWEITSPTGTTLYVLGTIHVGAEGSTNLPEAVLAAFDNATHLYAELSLEDMQELQQTLPQIIQNTLQVDDQGNPIPVTSLLEQDAAETLNQIIIASLGDQYSQEAHQSLDHMPVWFWTNSLATGLYQALGYIPDNGVDAILYNRGFASGKEIKGLDSIETQINVLTYGTLEQQVMTLQDMIYALMGKDGDEIQALQDLVGSYYNNDKETLAQTLAKSQQDMIDAYGEDYAKEYDELLYGRRNRSWADQMTTMLQQENQSYFIFAGSAHWLGAGNVFDLLVEDGAATW